MSSSRAAKFVADRVQNADPRESVELWIYSAFTKDDWVARQEGDRTHAEHPGTAIQMGEKLYEILTVERTAEGSYEVRYGLRSWDQRFAVRRLVPYTPRTQAQSAAEVLEDMRRRRLRARILWTMPLAGLAPDPMQREWEKQTGLKMVWVSVISALVEFGVVLSLRQLAGSSWDQSRLVWVIYYLVLESFLRLLWIVLTQRPHGSLLLTFPYLLWTAMARPERRAQRKQLRAFDQGDEVIRRPGGPLLIRSLLFDNWLAGSYPLRFEEVVYRPLHWHLEGKGLSRRWVYELERIEADPQANYRAYTQPRSAERQKEVEAFTHRLDLTQSFAPIWGTYPRREQLRLQLIYQFDSAKFTALTAGLFLLSAGLGVWMAILGHLTVFALASPAYLSLESLYRLYKSKVLGQPAGSLVGYLLSLIIPAPR